MFETFLLAFIPLFVTVDAIGTLPIFIVLTQNLKQQDKKRIIVQSVITALCVAIGFLAIGKFVFKVLGITMADFMIAGGVILLCIAIVDLIKPEKYRQDISIEELGAVPLGTPLIVGPAVLATSLMIMNQYGLVMTVLSLVTNILLTGFVFLQSEVLIKFLGKAGSNALSRVMAVLLAAIAVMMIRKGIFLIAAV